MFRSDQVITANKLIRYFTYYSKLVDEMPQPLLITRKSRTPLVLVNAEIFEALLSSGLKKEQSEYQMLSSNTEF